jgi:hypothetical protein
MIRQQTGNAGSIETFFFGRRLSTLLTDNYQKIEETTQEAVVR